MNDRIAYKISCLEYHYQNDRNVQKIYVLYPENKNTKSPVLYLIHGTGACSEWFDKGKMNIKENMENWVNEGSVVPMLIVIPDMNMAPKYGSEDKFEGYYRNILGLVEFINNTYTGEVYIDYEHTAIAGFSMGGAAALFYASEACYNKYKENHEERLFFHVGAFSPSSNVCGPKDHWLANNKEFITDANPNAIRFLGCGESEKWFCEAADCCKEYFEQNKVTIYANQIRIIQKGEHNFGTFLPLFEEFIKINFFKEK